MPRASSTEDGPSDIAYIGEDTDSEDFGRLAATFGVHVETADGCFVKGPEDVKLDEALAWARARAPRVLVILEGVLADAPEQALFSAGTQPIEEEGVHPWPASGIEVRPRPVGTRADGADQVRDWPIMIEFTIAKDRPRTSQRARRMLAEAVELKNQTWREADGKVEFRAEVRGGGYHDLEATVDPVSAALEHELGAYFTDLVVNLESRRRWLLTEDTSVRPSATPTH